MSNTRITDQRVDIGELEKPVLAITPEVDESRIDSPILVGVAALVVIAAYSVRP